MASVFQILDSSKTFSNKMNVPFHKNVSLYSLAHIEVVPFQDVLFLKTLGKIFKILNIYRGYSN